MIKRLPYQYLKKKKKKKKKNACRTDVTAMSSERKELFGVQYVGRLSHVCICCRTTEFILIVQKNYI